MQPFHTDLSHVAVCIFKAFCGLLARRFSCLNNTAVSGCATVHVTINPLKHLLMASSFGNFELNCYKYSYSGFLCISFQINGTTA